MALSMLVMPTGELEQTGIQPEHRLFVGDQA